MRLLIMSSEFPPGPGGIATHAYQLSLHLARRGCDVAVISPQDYASHEEIEKFNKGQPFRVILYKRARWQALPRLRLIHHWVKEWQPHIMLASGVRAVWLAALLTSFHQVPLVTVGHGGEFGTRLPWERLLTRLTFGKAHHVVCVSAYTMKRMLAMGVRPKNCAVIPNGADQETFRPVPRERSLAFRRRLGLNSASLLLTVGHVTERKGQDIVIRALPALREAIPAVHYLIAGLPTYRQALAALAGKLGVTDRVHFLGRVDLPTLVEAYNACDVFVMTSRHSVNGDFEGYGIAAVEAALCGKPAVVSRGSGLEEAIVPNHTGLVVPENDPVATAAALAHLLSDEKERQVLGKNAYEHASRTQTWERRAEAYGQVLRLVLS
jgi:phosphatidylinositol alpha-1,6-mannosyltransferase